MNNDLLALTAEIVSAYVSNNPLPTSELPALVADVSRSIDRLSNPVAEEPKKQAPAANPKRSVFPDYIVCLEDGKKFKSLKRHLMTHYNLTPDQYRAKWDLPRDYPMVAPSYAAARSQLARNMGLGRKPAEVVEAAQPKRRGRPAAVAEKTTAAKPAARGRAKRPTS